MSAAVSAPNLFPQRPSGHEDVVVEVRSFSGAEVVPEQESDYERALQLSRNGNFADFDDLDFLRLGGRDEAGRTLIFLLGLNLPAARVSLDRVLLYLIHRLDAEVSTNPNGYVLVYFHSDLSAENRPPFSWIRKSYTVLSRNYKKNLKALLIVHPTIWLRMALAFMSPFVSEKFWSKVTYVARIADLWDHIPDLSVRIPERIYRYEEALENSVLNVSGDDLLNGLRAASYFGNVFAPFSFLQSASSSDSRQSRDRV